MSISHSPEQTYLQEQFSEKLTEVQEWLQDRSIPYSVIGSVATAAHIDPEANWALNFHRPHATTPQERIPDIDLVVPRSSLAALRAYRETQLASDHPVSIGLSFPSRFIDMRPDESTSYLTSGKQRFPVKTETLKPQIETVLGRDVSVPDVTTLYYIHHMVGAMRPSDKIKVVALEGSIDETNSNYDNYRHMTQHRREHPGLVGRIDRTHARLTYTHPLVAQRIHKAALPVANLLGAR